MTEEESKQYKLYVTDNLRAGLQPKGSADIIRLQFIGGGFYKYRFVQDCVDELEQKAHLVAMGLDQFTNLEILAMQLLNDSSQM